MKNTRHNKLSGFTLDQTILVVAVIAILATIIISSVAWNVINRASATKMTAHLTQMSDAIGSFYQDNDFLWPATAKDLAPYLAGYTVSSTSLVTPFGTSSAKSLLSITNGNTDNSGGARLTGGASCGRNNGYADCYIVLTITNMQVQELEKANEAIDGPSETTPRSEGRLQWSAGAATARVEAKYFSTKLYR